MTALNPRQQVTAKAALTLIALHGHDPRIVQAVANAHIARGLAHRDAYTKAFENFVAQVPAMRTALEVVIELATKSDDATLAKYDAAINHYNNTGDDSRLEALAPMIVQDINALAVQNGEAEEGSALYDDIQAAFGIEEAAFAAEPFQADATAPAEAPSEAPQQASQFQFRNAVNTSQWSPRDVPREQVPAPAPAAPAGRAPTERERREADVPLGDIAYIQTPMGFRAVSTGEQARREAGVPLGPDA
ncbi:hypothetical protein [Sphingobium phenoxybenzoativorans]|uniref:hypothetical protein n=1 Tax=Sphingobium phenoxybenzoativorans TaxID=1592790 RepID=UPI0008724024|nr:hypothetical protein [Sphingobium phenoxybenzoativorans]